MKKCPWVLAVTILTCVGCTEHHAGGPEGADTTGTTEATDGTTTTDGELTTADSQGDTTDGEQGSDGETESVVDLAPGDAAPDVTVAAVVQGNPVEPFANDKVYVVEFWATWCGPCLASMPHISALQEEYGDEVQFIGITREDSETVATFMEQPSRSGEKWTDVLKYTIALDDGDATSQSYMAAANQNGIPCAFIVGRDAKVEWIGHPAQIDEPLSAVVAGNWDVTSARNSFVSEQRQQAQMEAAQTKLTQAMRSGDYESAVEVLDDLLKDSPDNLQLQMIRLQILGEGGLIEKFNEAAATIVDENFDEPMLLNQIAWTIATEMDDEKRDLDLALKAARQASTLSNDSEGSVLDTVARVYYEQGNLKDAIAWQKKAVEASPDMEDLQSTLEDYEAEANEGGGTEE